MLSTFGARSFHVAAPALWNSLPAQDQLRDIHSLAVFKKELKDGSFKKTQLFRETFLS